MSNMKSTSISPERMEAIEYIRKAINPKAFFSTIWEMLAGDSAEEKSSGAERGAQRIWDENPKGKQRINALEESRSGIPNGKGEKRQKRKKLTYEVKKPGEPSEIPTEPSKIPTRGEEHEI